MSRTAFFQGLMWTLPVVATGLVVLADNNPATDDVKRMIGYQGTLELDGTALSGPVSLELALYPSDIATTPVYRQCFTPTLAAGRFNVVLGPSGLPADNTTCIGTPTVSLATVVNDANDLHVGITVIDGQRGRIALENKQRVLPVPYTLWATEAANFKVNNDLSVTRNASVGGTMSAAAVNSSTTVTAKAYTPAYGRFADQGTGAGGAAIYNDDNVYKALMLVGNNSAGGAQRKVQVWDDLHVNGTATVNGLVANTTDFQLDPIGRRPVGSKPMQRALVHQEGDQLIINFDGDFEGGTQIQSNLWVQNYLSAGALGQRWCDWVYSGTDGYVNDAWHSVECPAGQYMAGWKCYASGYLDGSCYAKCCLP